VGYGEVGRDRDKREGRKDTRMERKKRRDDRAMFDQ
jgi:hypothetical protein